MLKTVPTRMDETLAAALACAGGRLSALAASLALAAALLLTPGGAWAVDECGAAVSGAATCDDMARNNIRYDVTGTDSLTLTVPGGTATTITAAGTNPGILLNAASGGSGNLALTVGSASTVSIVETGGDSVGIQLEPLGSGTSMIDLRDTVTIGTSGTRMGGSGIRIWNAATAGATTVTNAGAIYADASTGNTAGIFVRGGDASASAMTVTNTGTVDANGNAIWVQNALPGAAGAITVANSGTLRSANARGIFVRIFGSSTAATATVTLTGGAIEAAQQGVYVQSEGAGAVIVQGTAANAETQTGPIITSSGGHGIHVHKDGASATAGDISITTTGGSITTTADPGGIQRYHGIYVQDNAAYTGEIAIDNRASISAYYHAINVQRLSAGDISITHRGGRVLSRAQSGIFVRGPDSLAGDIDIEVTGGTVQAGPDSGSPAIRLTGRGDGDVSVTIAAGATAISYSETGVFAILSSAAADDSRVEIDQGGDILGRSGIVALTLKYTTAQTVAMRDAMDQPMIDIAWTGRFSAGTTAQTVPAGDLPTASDMFTVLRWAREAEASKVASGGAWDGPAGIEAQVMSWAALATEVATGDDPDAIADNTAQMAAVPTGATAADNAYVRQFRAVLESDDFVVAPSLLMAIGTTATTAASQLTDAEIVAYLRTDDGPTRTLLRDVLSRSLSEEEQAVVAALATGDRAGLAAALTAMGVMDDTADDADYWSRVHALLDRYNVGNIRVAMSDGFIVSRGDGIRAYYATANDNNGAIDVTVGEDAVVSAARAGIWVANAGLDEGRAGTADDILRQSVTVNGTVTGGTDAAVHLVGGGRLTVGETGILVAGAGRPAVLVNEPGRSVIQIAGQVRGAAGARAALDLSGGGSVIVTETGRINTNENGARAAIRVSGGTYEVAVYARGDRLTKLGVLQAIERVRGIVAGSAGTVVDRGNNPRSYAVVEMAGNYTTGRYLSLALTRGGEAVTEGNDMYALLPPGCPAGQEFQDGACVTPPPPPPPPPDMPAQPGTGMPQQPGQPQQPQQPVDGQQPQRPVERPLMAIDCRLANDDCRLYEALPSALLALNRLPSYGERMAAPRNAGGGWARVEAARGDWVAASSTQAGLAYDYDRSGVRAGIDMAMGESGRIGLTMHALEGVAELTPNGGGNGGQIGLSGLGLGVNGTAMAGSIYIDAQAAATWLDVEVTSATGVELKDGAEGLGFALALEAGRPTAMGGSVTVTPRAGFVWSKVSLDNFADTMAGRRVAMEDASSLAGRLGLGVAVQAPGGMTVAASLDAMQEFSEETELGLEARRLKASAETSSVRVGLSAAHSWGENRYALQASAAYTTGGSDNSELAGGLSLSIRF